MSNQKPILLDCTFRDGGYYNNWDFDIKLINQYLDTMDKAGIDFAEIGFRFLDNNNFKGPCAYMSDDYIDTLKIPKKLKISIMLNATDFLTNNKFDKDKLSILVPKKASRSKVNLIRIASHYGDFKATLEACKILKNKGYLIGANLMQISEITITQIKSISKIASKSNIDVLYFADSLGSLEPNRIQIIADALNYYWKGSLGIHAHDNKGMALINSKKAIDLGIKWIDSTILGMGRGPGNLKTEQIILEINNKYKNKNNIFNLHKLINDHFVPMQNKFKWGTNLFYHLAGQYSIHPTYIQEMINYGYKDEDIFSAIENLKNLKGKKFDKSLLKDALNFYSGSPKGTFTKILDFYNKDILLIGSGKSVEKYNDSIVRFIKHKKPTLVSINTISGPLESKVKYIIACNPIKILSQIDKFTKNKSRLIMPISMMPTNLNQMIKNKVLFDYGIKLKDKQFIYSKKYCIVPNNNAFSYAMAVLIISKVKKVYLAGFDGYEKNLNLNNEINQTIAFLNKKITLISITPSIYDITQKSLFSKNI